MPNISKKSGGSDTDRMAKKFNELRDKVRERPGAAERIDQYRREEEREHTLAELRRARNMTQASLANSLGMTQPGISRIEQQTDVYLSTLRSYIEALGGSLELTAVFSDGAVPIKSLEELEEDLKPAGKTVTRA
jgi:DNA-binding XRE family transcriptional regulator